MKKTAKAFLPILFLLLFTISINAALIDEVIVTDVENSIVRISGSLPGKVSNRLVTVFILNDGTAGLEESSDTEGFTHIDVALVSYDGDYSYSFKLPGESGIYTIRVFNGSVYADAEIGIYNTEEVEDFARKISEGLLSNAEIFKGLEKYSQMLALDINVFDTESLKKMLLKRIDENRQVIKQQGISGIQAVFEAAVLEAKLLDDIKNTENWYQVYDFLSATTDITGINFTDYNKLQSKSSVCSALVKREFADADELKKKFDELVRAALKAQNSAGSNPEKTFGGGGVGGSVIVPQLAPVIPETPEAKSAAVFDDISNVGWAKEAIERLYNGGIITGVGNNKFDPDASVKREEFTKMIVKACAIYDETAASDYSDTNLGDWHYTYISSAKKAGLIYGKDDALFGVGDLITRQDIAVILYRAAVLQGAAFGTKSMDFNDFNLISDYAREAVACLYAGGIINGMGDGSFAPVKPATRAQAATLVYNFLKEFGDHE